MDFIYGKLWTGIGPLNHASTIQLGSADREIAQEVAIL
jgi:hypothetical protein